MGFRFNFFRLKSTHPKFEASELLLPKFQIDISNEESKVDVNESNHLEDNEDQSKENLLISSSNSAQNVNHSRKRSAFDGNIKKLAGLPPKINKQHKRNLTNLSSPNSLESRI